MVPLYLSIAIHFYLEPAGCYYRTQLDGFATRTRELEYEMAATSPGTLFYVLFLPYSFVLIHTPPTAPVTRVSVHYLVHARRFELTELDYPPCPPFPIPYCPLLS